MRTSKILTRSFTTLALAAALVAGVSALIPVEAFGAGCFSFTHTRNVTGTHSMDCPWAIANFHQNANAIADDTCGSMGQGVCFYDTSDPQHCNQTYPPFTVNGTVSFRCSGPPQQF